MLNGLYYRQTPNKSHHNSDVVGASPVDLTPDQWIGQRQM